MSNRTLFYLLGAVFIAMGIMFISNLALFFNEPESEKYLNVNNIRGMELMHDGKAYTLNFQQQSQIVEQFNFSVPISREIAQENLEATEIEKIVIYRFQGPDIEITPIGFKDGYFVFSTPLWHPQGYLIETAPHVLKTLLPTTYDP